MSKLKKLFGGLHMGWGALILFALAAGVYTGLINSVHFLNETSFRDIAVTFEWWVVFAVIIVVNCEKPLDAALKCFVFFLISQPLVYVVESPFSDFTLEYMLRAYYMPMWFRMTFATLPGGFVAWYCKKQNIFGAVVLGVGNAIIGAMGVYYAKSLPVTFPRHILTVLFCLAAVIVMPLCVQEKKRERLVTFLVTLILVGAFALLEGSIL